MFRPPQIASTLLVLLAAPALAQTTLVRSGGVIGGPLVYSMQGDPGEAYALLPSPQPGPTPVSLFNPGDPRVLSVSLNTPSLWTIGVLGAGGTASRSYQLPNEPALQGLIAYAQFITFTTGPTRIDDISNPTSFRFAQSGTSHLTVGQMLRDASSPTATTLDDGRVLVAGGSKTVAGSSVVASDTELFDPQTQTFAAGPSMSVARVLHTATRLADGRVLLLGGSDDADLILSSGDVFDPVAGTITPIAPMSVARAGHTATLLGDGRVFVAGGTSDFDFSDPLAALGSVHRSTAVYDPSTDTWSNGPDLPRPRVLAAATMLDDGRALVSGGIEVTTILFPIPSFTGDCRVFDPGSGSLQAAAAFDGPRALHALHTLSDGTVLLVGGTDGDLLSQVFTPVATCRLYAPGSNSWTNVGSMASPRVLGTTLVERAGEVYVIGGLSTVDLTTLTGTPVTDVEVATLGAFAWSVAGSMTTGRPVAASAAIEDGARILTVGSSGVGVDLTAEVFVP